MTHTLRAALLLGLALSALACQEERAQRVAASYSSVARRTERPFPTPRPTPKPLAGIDAVPAEEDYEARAAATITEENFEAKLTELEQELRQ